MNTTVGVVIIGRNEGERLARCLRSVNGVINRVYVDSGSTDASVSTARDLGFQLVELSDPPPFTAARARNAGLAKLLDGNDHLDFVQLIDGDCELQPGWLDAGLSALKASPDLALVFGRRRERFPDRSVYNALCDDEWNSPVGDSPGCGGDVLFRVTALRQVGFYNAMMIAGEDSELSYRLRTRGWRLLQIADEMTLHDADILHFRQWWKRIKRSGHGYAEMAFLHPDAKEPNWPRSVRSILAWGGMMPLAMAGVLLLSILWTPWWLLAASVLGVAWVLKIGQLTVRQYRRGLSAKVAIASGLLLMVGKVPQLFGAINYHLNRISGRASRLIEYKATEL